MQNSLINSYLGGQDTNQIDSDAKLTFIDLDALHNRKDNRSIDLEKVDEIAKSIKEDGLGQAILVRRSKEGGFEIIAGQHRAEAFRILKKDDPSKYSKIPAIERNIDDKNARRLMLATNVINNALSPEDRRAALTELYNDAKELRNENKEEFKGVKTSQITADILEEQTGVKVSQATIERDMQKLRDQEEKIDNKREFIENKLTRQWQSEQLHATDLKDDVLKGVSQLKKETQKQIADTVLSYNPQSKSESKHLTECALKIKNNELEKITEKGRKDIEQYCTDLSLAKDLGEDITEAILELNTYLEFKLKELGGEDYEIS